MLLVDSSADHGAIKKQVRNLFLLTHPDKNKSVAADGAFKIVREAWSMLQAEKSPEVETR